MPEMPCEKSIPGILSVKDGIIHMRKFAVNNPDRYSIRTISIVIVQI